MVVSNCDKVGQNAIIVYRSGYNTAPLVRQKRNVKYNLYQCHHLVALACVAMAALTLPGLDTRNAI